VQFASEEQFPRMGAVAHRLVVGLQKRPCWQSLPTFGEQGLPAATENSLMHLETLQMYPITHPSDSVQLAPAVGKAEQTLELLQPSPKSQESLLEQATPAAFP